MSQTRVITALLVLVCASALAVWYFLDLSGTQVHAPALTDSAANLDGSQPLEGKPAGNETLKVPVDGFKHTDTTDPDANPTKPEYSVTELGPDDWLLRGTITFSPEIPLDSARMFAGNDRFFSVFFQEDAEEDGAFEISPEAKPDGRFEYVIERDELEFVVDDDKLRPGRWQIVFDRSGEVLTLADVGDDVTLEQITGLVSPTATGHVIDFGSITLGHGQVFGDSWVVVGRIKHASGKPISLCSSPVLAIENRDEDVNEEYLATDEDGRFAIVLTSDSVPDNPQAWKTTLCASDDDSYLLSEGRKVRTSVPLDRPAVRGRTVDYGEISVNGALIEIEAHMPGIEPVLTPEGKLARSLWNDYVGATASLYLGDSLLSRSTDLYPSPSRTVLWLPEGRYSYDARVNEPNYWSACEGIVNAIDGQVTMLTLTFQKFEIIPVVFETEGDLPQWVTAYWYIGEGEKVLASGSYDGMPNMNIPVAPGATTFVNIHARGFKEVDAEATDSDERLLVPLTPWMTAVATLIVNAPALPEGYTDWPIPRLISVTRKDDGISIFYDWPEPEGDNKVRQQGGPTQAEVPVPAAGIYQVSVVGGSEYGYPGGVLSGLVEVTIVEGQTATVTLPPIAPPPWKIPASALTSKVTCAGNSISITSPVFTGQESTEWTTLTTGQDISMDAPPVALPDGDQRREFSVEPPTKDSVRATVTLDLECRLEVHATRRGEAVHGFSITASGPSGASGQSTTVVVSDKGGVVQAWMPPGTVWVNCNIGGSVAGKAVEITRGGVARLDFEFDSVRVEFQMAEIPDESYDANTDIPPAWRVYRITESGRTEVESLWGPTVMLLSPARYVVVACYGEPVQTIEMDLSDGKDRVITLPELPSIQFVPVRLKFDVSVLGPDWSDADIEFATADQLTTPLEDMYFSWMGSRAMPDGLELIDVPLGADLVLTGTAYHSGTDKTWVMKPLRIHVKGEGESYACTWVQGVERGETWWEHDFFSASSVNGLFIPVASLEALPPGRIEIVALDSTGKIVVREWVTVPDAAGEDGFEVPESLRAAMITAGLWQADDPE